MSRWKIAVGLRRSSRTAAHRNKHMWRAKIVLATADGCGTAEIMRRSGKAKPVVWRWHRAVARQDVGPGKKPLSAATVERVVDLALAPPPGETTHWNGPHASMTQGSPVAAEADFW